MGKSEKLSGALGDGTGVLAGFLTLAQCLLGKQKNMARACSGIDYLKNKRLHLVPLAPRNLRESRDVTQLSAWSRIAECLFWLHKDQDPPQGG